MALIKVKEIIGTSEKSFDDALKQAIKQCAKAKKNLTGVRIIGQNAEIKDGEIVEYKVNAKIAYKWESANE
jgi:flavin-binding protein dodecin